MSTETGDMVFIHDQDHPRGFWKMAKVLSLITGKDGVVRGATLKVAAQSGPPTILQRPLQLLYPLEIGTKPPITEETGLEGESTEQQTPKACEQQEESPATSRPRREAATRGRRLVKQWCASENLIDHD